jgi:hypothetical protein
MVVPLAILIAIGSSMCYTRYVFSFVCDYIQIQVSARDEEPPTTASGIRVRDDTRAFLNKHCR